MNPGSLLYYKTLRLLKTCLLKEIELKKKTMTLSTDKYPEAQTIVLNRNFVNYVNFFGTNNSFFDF